MARAYDLLFKILFVGDSGVGKTSLLHRYTEDIFISNFISTIGIDFKIKRIMCDDKLIKLQLWDTAGQERFKTITTAYYHGAMAIILVYDICNEKSFRNIESWIQTIANHTDNVVLLLIGNKCDASKRVIKTEDGKLVASKYNALFFETSAKDNTNIDFAISQLVAKIMKKYNTASHQPHAITLDDQVDTEKSKTKKKSICLI
jgi:Ras-related protein Rab-8A